MERFFEGRSETCRINGKPMLWRCEKRTEKMVTLWNRHYGVIRRKIFITTHEDGNNLESVTLFPGIILSVDYDPKEEAFNKAVAQIFKRS